MLAVFVRVERRIGCHELLDLSKRQSRQSIVIDERILQMASYIELLLFARAIRLDLLWDPKV
jgi:hypothetical protein